MPTANTLAIVERHWRALTEGKLDELIADYAENAVLITGATGAVKGREAIGELLKVFVTHIIPAASTRFTLVQTHVDAALGYIVWSAESPTHRIAFGSDTFVIDESGRISMQTSAGNVETK